MHKHRDDIAGVPFLFLTPTRRPVSRPSSRASSPSVRLIPNRPDTPNSAPTPQLFRRSPLPSILGTSFTANSQTILRSDSTHSSPIFTQAQVTHTNVHLAASLPSSPLSSPRLLNAKAS